jgi:hypothetical protein
MESWTNRSYRGDKLPRPKTYDKVLIAMGMEHLNHAIFGLQPMENAPPAEFPQREDCTPYDGSFQVHPFDESQEDRSVARWAPKCKGFFSKKKRLVPAEEFSNFTWSLEAARERLGALYRRKSVDTRNIDFDRERATPPKWSEP